MKRNLLVPKTALAFLMALFSAWGWGQTPFVMANGDYTENFSDISNWTNNFASGIGTAPFKSVAVNTSGTLGDGVRTTVSSASFATGTSGGVQKGTGNFVFLSTSTTNAVAVDLYLNFTNRNAGAISFDAATINNGSGNRDSVLKVFYSINGGTSFTEITGTNLPYTGRNNVVNNSTVSLALPTSFNNLANAIVRFYEYSTAAGGASVSGSQPKISIDNLSITSTSGSTPTIYTVTPTALDTFSESFGGASSSDVRSFTTNADNLSANLVITPPSNWEISLSSTSGFSNNAVSLSPISNTVAQTTIYVRLASGVAVGSYSGNITLTSTGATTKNINVIGNVNLANPIVIAATNITNTSFIANWNAVSGATGYFIDVYKTTPVNTLEGFSTAPTAPSGWSFSGTTSYTGIGGVATPSVKFDDTADRIISPLYTNDISEIKFWIQGQATTTATPSALLIEGFNGVSWVTIDNITPISTSAITYTYNSTSSVVLPNNLKQFRFTYTKGAGNVAFDDFGIIEKQKVYATGFQNKSLTNILNSLVDGLTPATEYFYVVRATDGTATSSNSNVISATTTSLTSWNGTTWSSGAPSSLINAVIAGNYSTTSQPIFTARNITIQNGAVLEITSGNTITGENIVVENGGNLIQRDGSTLTYSGTFTVNKTGASAANKYAFWASPVANQNLTTIFGGTPPQFITQYNTATNYFVNAATTSVVGKGYSIKNPVANAAVSFVGTPNNNDITFTLDTSSFGYNLVGNPYPSDLNLVDFYNANSTKIGNTFYFWDSNSDPVVTQTGNTTTNVGYATYNPNTQVWAPAPNVLVNPTGNVAKVAQGFFVQATNAADTSLSFTNAMRTSTTGSFFNKNNPSSEGKFWLKLSTSYNANNTFVVAYLNGASNTFDAYDSKALGTGSDAFYTFAGTEKLIIQGKGGFNTSDVVPVGAKHFETGNFNISLTQKEGVFNNGQAIYLHDMLLGTYTNLQNTSYNFTANAGEITDRFEIVYQLGTLSTSETQKSGFEVYRQGDDFYVRNSKNIEEIEVFDAAGRKVQEINSASQLVKIHLDTKGFYIIKARSAGKEYFKKITY